MKNLLITCLLCTYHLVIAQVECPVDYVTSQNFGCYAGSGCELNVSAAELHDIDEACPRYIKVNLNFIQRDDGSGNYTETAGLYLLSVWDNNTNMATAKLIII